VSGQVSARTVLGMGTFVTIQVVDRNEDPAQAAKRDAAVDRAFDWFRAIESCCSRFDADSELRRISASAVGTATPASPMLFEAVRFALAVAEETGGAFDPTVGCSMEARGFDREHWTGETIRSDVGPSDGVSYRDVELDPARKTIALRRPLVLDLGAVAKGLAIDMAARELRPLEHFAIDAGGDLYLGGRNVQGERWRVGIRHPRVDGALIDAISVSDAAVCTSGDYERRAPGANGGHHILDPRTGESAAEAASVTVVAPTAMLADAVATAAFVLGPADGLRLVERLGLHGLVVTSTLDCFRTRGMPSEHTNSDGSAPVGGGDAQILSYAERAPHHHPAGPAVDRGAERRP